jgi:hypothetical protein
MQSAFTPRMNPQATSSPAVEETYDLKGLNLITPDAVMPAGESPWTINSRSYARDEGDTRVANRTRKGSGYLSIPVGETADVQNVATAIGDVAFSPTQVIAQPIVFSGSGALTRLQPAIKKLAGATGHVIVEIWSDNAGFPGQLIAQGSILASTITTSYQYLSAYFIDAPSVVAGTQYWLVCYTQDNGSGTYYLNQTAQVGGVADMLSLNAGGSWSTIAASIRYKTYISTVGKAKGFTTRYPSNSVNKIIFAHGTTVQAFSKGNGVLTAIDTGRDANASIYRFAQMDDYTLYTNGYDKLRQWDGTNAPSDVANVPTNTPSNVIMWQNRCFVMSASTRVDFSELSDITTWPSVNFFYVPTPLSADHMSGWKVFQDNLVIFTHETKHVITGSDISSFTRREAIGTKGAVSQEAIVADRNYIYFMADDGQIYRYNGVSDQLLSDKIQPELQGISNMNTVRLDIYRNQLRVYYAKNPKGYADRMALLDLETMQWFLDTGHPVMGSMNLYLDNNELIEFSSLVGAAYYGETQGSDLGKKIDYKFWTNYKTYAYRKRSGQTFGGASAKKRIKRFRPIVRTVDADYTLSVGKDMNFQNTPDMRAYEVSGGGAKWGAFKWGDGTKWGTQQQVQNRSGMSGRGEHIQYRFERNGVETPVELYGYISQYKIGRQK